MKKLVKKATRAVQSGTEIVINAIDLARLDEIIERILNKVTNKIESYDYSTITSRDEIAVIAEKFFEEGFQQYDKKAGVPSDDSSNITQRRKHLRRGFETKLQLFYTNYDNYITQSREKLLELQNIEKLINAINLEINQNESSLLHEIDTPDIISQKYDNLKNHQFEIFKLKLNELNLTALDQPVIDHKIQAFHDSLVMRKMDFLEKQEQATLSLWRLIQQEFKLTKFSIEEKKRMLSASLPCNIKSLEIDLQSFRDSTISRICSFVPNGEKQIQAITVYMIAKHHNTLVQEEEQQEIVENSDLKSPDMTEHELEEDEAYLTFQDIQNELNQLQVNIKESNLQAVILKIEEMTSSYGYRVSLPIHLIE